MTASLIPVSHGEPMVFTKDAASAVWVFFLTNTADGSPATGKTIAGSDFRISKNGGAFGNAAGVVTEISLGWYKMAWAAADLNTAGPLACELSVEAGVDPIHCVHQVQLLDVNTATVNPGAGGIVAASFGAGAIDAAAVASGAISSAELADGSLTAAKFGSDALAAISASLEQKVIRATLAGATGDAAISMRNAVDAVVEVTGTYGGGSVQMQTCEDPAAASPVWTNSGSALSSDGSRTVAGPHSAVRAHMTGATGAALAVKFTVRKPAGL
jgi:hypothetical protein